MLPSAAGTRPSAFGAASSSAPEDERYLFGERSTAASTVASPAGSQATVVGCGSVNDLDLD